MEEILYLEADEEITSVVDKIKGLDAKSIGLVAPKGATIVQSVVSLKLLKKEAETLGREIAIITSDDVGRSLASRVGLPVFADTKSGKPLDIEQAEVPDVREVIEIDMGGDEKENLPEGFEVHRYDQGSAEKERKDDKSLSSSGQISANSNRLKSDRKDSGFTKRSVSSEEKLERVEREPLKPSVLDSKKIVGKTDKVKRNKWKIIVLLLGIVVAIVLADLVFAKVKVDIVIPAEELKESVAVTVERDRSVPDLEAGIIPGTQIQKEEEFSRVFYATGEKNAGEKAVGKLTFKNESGLDESIEAGTTVVSSSGLEFILQTSITVPKASLNSAGDKILGQISGTVEAKSPGDSYNMPASTSYSVYGKPKISVSGGTSGGVTKKIKIVSHSDIADAEEELKEKAKTKLMESINQEKGEKSTVEDAYKIEVISFTTTKNANDEATEFEATARIRMTTLAYDQEQLEQVSLEQIKKGLEEGEGILATQEDKFEISLDSSDINIGKMQLNVAVLTHVGPEVDLTGLSSAWRLKTLSQIKKQAGEIPEAQIKEVSVWPKYALPISPILKDRIIINLEYIKKK